MMITTVLLAILPVLGTIFTHMANPMTAPAHRMDYDYR